MTPEGKREHELELARARSARYYAKHTKRAASASAKWQAENREKRLADGARWRAGHPGYWLKANVRKHARWAQAKKAGWTREDFERAEARRPTVQACECCNSPAPGRSWIADHCHSAGTWRGFLCDGCNKRLTRAALLDMGLLSPKEIAYLRASECAHCRQAYE
jgi:hypothetical protein